MPNININFNSAIDFNDLIHKTKENFNYEDIRLFVSLINKIDLSNISLGPFNFTMQEFCDLYQMSYSLNAIKDIIKNIADTSMMINTTNGGSRLFRWINKATIYPKEEMIEIYLDEELISCFIYNSINQFRLSF